MERKISEKELESWEVLFQLFNILAGISLIISFAAIFIAIIFWQGIYLLLFLPIALVFRIISSHYDQKITDEKEYRRLYGE